MHLPELCDHYRAHARRTFTKHGRPTSTVSKVNAALAAWLELTIAEADLRGRPATRPGFRAVADLDAADLHKLDLADFQTWLGGRRKPRGGFYAISTIKEYRGLVLAMLKWAAEEELVDSAVEHRLSKAKIIKPGRTNARRKEKVTSASEEVIFGVVAYCRRHAETFPAGRSMVKRRRRWLLLAVAIELMWELGSRPIELTIMRRADIVEDPKLGTVYRPAEWKTEHKDAQVRTLIVSSRAQALIDEAVELNTCDGEQQRLNFAQTFDPTERLFPWKASNPNHARSAFYKALRSALVQAGLPAATLCQIRHAFATRAFEISPEGTRQQLGHTNLRTTMVYVDASSEAQRRLFDQLDAPPASPTPPPTPPATPSPTSPGPSPAGSIRPPGEDDERPPLRLVGT